MKNNLKLKEQVIVNDEKISNFKQANQEFKKSNKEDGYDNLYMSEQSKLELCPPKNSLSELVYNNKLEELAKKLNEADVSPDCRDEIGVTASWTPLYWSIKLRKIECAKLLLSYGADINVVINDFNECCGTVLDLATLRCDDEIEELLREYAEKEDVNLGIPFKAIRTKLRGKAPSFYFNTYGKKKSEE